MTLWLRHYCLYFTNEEIRTQRKFLLHGPRGSRWYGCYENGAAWQCEVSPAWLQGMVLHQNPTASRHGSYKEYRVLIHFQDLFYSSCARKSLYMNCWNHTYTSVPPGSHIWSPISRSSISFTLPHPFGILGSNGPMSASIKLPDSYRITSFSTLRSVIIWNQKISWPLLTGFRVKETSRYPWIFRASYWFLSLLGSWKNSVLGTCYS